MSIGLIFWILMLFWLIFGLYSNRVSIQGGNWAPAGDSLMLFILLFLLGWKSFGFIIQG